MKETRMRAISSVFDVTLCLLVVSASAFVLVDVQSPDTVDKASNTESTANVLATSTAQVNYTIQTESRRLPRTTHDTLAGLLADAAVSNTTVRGVELTRTGDGFERSVANRVQERLGSPSDTQIVVRWTPYRNSHIRGQFAVGESPPRDAAVHATVLSVPSGLPGVRDDAIDAARGGGYRDVARVVATGIVSGLFPKRSTEIALRDRRSVANSVAGRSRRLRKRYDPDSLSPDIGSMKTRRMLVRSMTTAIESELREQFGAPTAAARSAAVGRTELVVRTWSK
ncbi:DUF7284 family protein [Haladaptatus caseinilyticus]|uniref:DUF7284 family protein n=1 Tax=Haladaptatus caseinilyticus TaxID=2993314 RepID=UPI00224A76EC|nr:hypothetical protein [Haladaptatus caseinilyticus]